MLARQKLILAVALFVLMLSVLAGCGAKDEKQDDQQGDDVEQSETDTGTRTIEHAMGKTDVPANPQRVVILTNHGTEAMLALGVKPVGAVKSWTGDPWYPHIADQMDGVEVVGVESEVNLEAVAALEPDLIIGNKTRQEGIYDQLNAIAPTVFEEALRGDWKINFKLIADTLNKADKGEEVLAAYDSRIDELQSKLGDKLDMKVSMVRFLAGDVRIYQKDSFSGIILQDIGFARPASQDVDAFAITGVSKERISDMDGDILFYFTYELGDGEANKVEEDWINDPLFKNLNVSKAGKVYKVRDDIWNTAGGVIAANLMLDDIEKYFLE